jgi:2-oxoglutarate dehydrogenase E2 component (dihydrolipoamide succinyltransferase)
MAARRLVAILLGASGVLALGAAPAWAQVVVDPTVTPAPNRSGLGPLVGPVTIAAIFAVIAALVVLVIALAYLRFAPRFSRDEEAVKVVPADRIVPGREPPRRAVDLSKAAPIVVEPPKVPALSGTASGGAQAPAAAAAPSTPPAAAPSTPPAAAPSTPAAAPSTPAAAPAAPEPVAAAPTPAAPTPAAPTPAAPAVPDVEVTMDQEVYERTLAELLEQGTDRRIAEGRARRAGMIAAKKKAAAE